MTQFIKYELEDGTELWVQKTTIESGVVRASAAEKIEDARQSFEKALESVKKSALKLREQFEAAKADEVEVKFGLVATGEIGNNIFAVGKAGVEANYEVTLKWKKKESDAAQKRIQSIRRRYGIE